jgi:hypothetical protein
LAGHNILLCLGYRVRLRAQCCRKILAKTRPAFPAPIVGADASAVCVIYPSVAGEFDAHVSGVHSPFALGLQPDFAATVTDDLSSNHCALSSIAQFFPVLAEQFGRPRLSVTIPIALLKCIVVPLFTIISSHQA